MIMLSKITGVFGTCDPDHLFDPISITTFETGQGQYHVLTGTFKAEKVNKNVIRYLADVAEVHEVHVHNGQHVADGVLLMVGVVLVNKKCSKWSQVLLPTLQKYTKYTFMTVNMLPTEYS